MSLAKTIFKDEGNEIQILKDERLPRPTSKFKEMSSKILKEYRLPRLFSEWKEMSSKYLKEDRLPQLFSKLKELSKTIFTSWSREWNDLLNMKRSFAKITFFSFEENELQILKEYRLSKSQVPQLKVSCCIWAGHLHGNISFLRKEMGYTTWVTRPVAHVF